VAPDKNMQEQIIRSRTRGEVLLDLSPELKPGERDDYLKHMAEFGDDSRLGLELSNMITKPGSPEQGPKNPADLFSSISANNQLRGFVAEFAKGDFRKIDRLGPKDLGNFLNRYSNPYYYRKDAMNFLRRIEADYSPEVAESYRQSLDIFLKSVYGDECYGAYKQMEYLREEADSKYPEKAKWKFVMSRHPDNDNEIPLLEKDKTRLIGEAKSLEDLDLALHRINGIQGSVDTYPVPQLLMEDIRKVVDGQMPIETITRTYGLRAKVAEIAEIESVRRKIA